MATAKLDERWADEATGTAYEKWTVQCGEYRPRREDGMGKMQRNKRIKEIPGDGGWWHDGYKDFQKVADRLSELGMNDDEIVKVLGTLYSVVANEFGA